MHKHKRNVLLTLTTLTAVGLPLAGRAFAQQKAPSAQLIQAQGTQTRRDSGTDNHQEGTVRGSLQLPAETPHAEMSGPHEAALQYRALVKITPAQARQAAQAAVSGTVTRVRLEDEDGSLVYAVVIGQTEVLVDAGNGRVLRQEAHHEGQDDGPGADHKESENGDD